MASHDEEHPFVTEKYESGDAPIPRARSDVCDRRQSRAARSILESQALPLLRHHLGGAFLPDPTSRKAKKTTTTTTLAPLELWEALEQSIPFSKIETCELNPNRDLYKHHEFSSHKQKTVPSMRLPYGNMKYVYKCGICGKVFLTRYYLDLHLDHKHDQLPAAKNWTCPAVTWCRALGGLGACQQEALDQEPYYGRGSSGLDVDSIKIRHEWSRITHSYHCQPEKMLESQQYCQELMTTCFQDDLAKDLIHAVCDGITCQDVLFRLMGQARRHVHTWKEEWNMHSQHGRFGWSGILLLLLLVGYYAFKVASKWFHQQQRTHNSLWGSGKHKTQKQSNFKSRLEEIRKNKIKSKLQ